MLLARCERETIVAPQGGGLHAKEAPPVLGLLVWEGVSGAGIPDYEFPVAGRDERNCALGHRVDERKLVTGLVAKGPIKSVGTFTLKRVFKAAEVE